jgi:hypothetical protein
MDVVGSSPVPGSAHGAARRRDRTGRCGAKRRRTHCCGGGSAQLSAGGGWFPVAAWEVTILRHDRQNSRAGLASARELCFRRTEDLRRPDGNDRASGDLRHRLKGATLTCFGSATRTSALLLARRAAPSRLSADESAASGGSEPFEPRRVKLVSRHAQQITRGQRHRAACGGLSSLQRPPSRSHGPMHKRRVQCRQPALPRCSNDSASRSSYGDVRIGVAVSY